MACFSKRLRDALDGDADEWNDWVDWCRLVEPMLVQRRPNDTSHCLHDDDDGVDDVGKANSDDWNDGSLLAVAEPNSH